MKTVTIDENLIAVTHHNKMKNKEDKLNYPHEIVR